MNHNILEHENISSLIQAKKIMKSMLNIPKRCSECNDAPFRQARIKAKVFEMKIWKSILGNL